MLQSTAEKLQRLIYPYCSENLNAKFDPVLFLLSCIIMTGETGLCDEGGNTCQSTECLRAHGSYFCKNQNNKIRIRVVKRNNKIDSNQTVNNVNSVHNVSIQNNDIVNSINTVRIMEENELEIIRENENYTNLPEFEALTKPP